MGMEHIKRSISSV